MATDETRDTIVPLTQIAEQDPSNRDAPYLLGEIYTHSATRNDARKAADMYGRLLALDPGLALVYEHALSAYLRDRRFDEASAHLQAWKQISPDSLKNLDGMLALWTGRLPEAAEILGDELAPAILLEPADSPAMRAVLAASVPEIVESLKDKFGLYRVVELDLRADVLAYHGRFEAAAELYRLAADVPGTWSRDGFMSNTRVGSRQRLAFLLALNGHLDEARAEVAAVLKSQPDSFRCLYMSALFALRDHDVATARDDLDVLTDLSGRDWSPTASLYRDAIAAELALAEGRAADARNGFAALVNSGKLMEDWYAHEDSIGPLLRDGLARACVAAGDTAGAAAALDGLIDSGLERLRHPVPWVLALFSKGMLDLEAGREASGRALLSRFLNAWGQADWVVPQVAEARARLRALDASTPDH